MKKNTYMISAYILVSWAVSVSAQESIETLSLSDAVNRSLEYNLVFSILQNEIEMADAEAEQAGLFPNPVLSGGMESITTDTDANNPEQRQDMVGITQPIPLGGALQKARRVSELEREQLEAELETLKIELASDTKTAFYEVVYYQEVLDQLDELQSILNDVLQVSKSRLEQGDIAEIEVIRVEANHERFSIESEIAESHLINTKTRLAAIMGNPNLDIGRCQGDLEPVESNLTFESLTQQLDSHPRKAVWQKREVKAEAKIEKAKADSYPQLEIGTNYRRFAASDQDTFDFTVGISIPIFNRNQGAIRYHKENLEREQLAIAYEQKKLEEQIKVTLENVQTHQERIDRFKNNILPKIEETSRISQTSYSAGDVSILEVLDAYRNLAESRLTYLQELIELKKSMIQLEKLIGKEI